jgi:hypothetical protein
MDFVAMAEYEWGHAGVPVSGLMPEVHPRFEHFSHRHGHNFSSLG